MRGKTNSPVARAWFVLALAGMVLTTPACQGTSSGTGGPRPRSREAAGTNANLPYETTTKNRKPFDDAGGELEYQGAKLTIPRGAVDQTVFFEISIPDEQPGDDVLPGSAVQLSPNTLELRKDGLLTIGYAQSDIPVGKNEENLVIVHQVNGIWVELSNSKVYPHDNLVEAPIRFLGLYGLRLVTEDPRKMNAAPVALFEFSDEAYPDQHANNAATAEKKAVDDAAAAAAKQQSDQVGAPGSGGTGGETTLPGGVAPTTGGDTDSAPGGNPSTNPNLPPGTGAGNASVQRGASVFERRFVGGPAALKKPAAVNKRKKTATSKKGAAASGKQASQAPAGGSATGPVAPPPVDQPPAADDELLRRREQDQLSAPGGTAGSLPGQPGGATGAGKGGTPSVAETDAPKFSPKPGQVGQIRGDGADITVYFNASASSDPDGNIVQYDWDWDADGVFDYTSHSRAYAEHTFRYNGDYSVVLKVTDNGRYPQSSYAVGTVEVRSARAIPKPIAANISAFPPFGPAPLTAHFAATLTGGTAPYVYKWTFSDGSESNLPNPFTTYPTTGSFPVRFSATDVKGARLTGNLQVQVESRDAPGSPQPRLELAIDPSVERGQAPFTAYFKLTATRATQPVTYRITYGDEDPSQDETVTTSGSLKHVYPNTGFYIVKIVATDADLRTASTFATVNAFAPADARDFTTSSATFSGDPFSYGHGMHISFDYTEASQRTVKLRAVDPPKPATELAFNWDFGDGNFSTEATPTHTFARDGVYEVRCSASDSVQRWRQRIWLPVAQKTTAVAIQRPSYVEGPAPLRLSFDAIVTRGTEPLHYDWTFGDTRRSDASPRFSFDKPGDYNVNLTVKDKFGSEFTAPQTIVKVRPGPPDYQLPLAVIGPVTGSTRAEVVDYTGASVLPLSNPLVEGAVKLVDLSADGQFVGLVTDDGLLVKRVRDAAPVLSFLPAAGILDAARVVPATAGPVAYVTLTGAGGAASWMLRTGSEPVRIGNGTLAAVSGDGTAVVLAPKSDGKPQAMTQYRCDPEAGQIGAGTDFGRASAVALDGDGRTAYYIAGDNRLVRRDTRTGAEAFLGTGKEAKHGLACSADGSSAVFVAGTASGENIIYGHQADAGDFRLTSVTDKTGWSSGYLRLSADGRFLLTYGSRSELAALLDKAGKHDKPDADGKSPVDGEMAPSLAASASEEAADKAAKGKGKSKTVQPRQRERFGLVRLDLSAPPEQWTIAAVNPRFVVECNANFATAGPFD